MTRRKFEMAGQGKALSGCWVAAADQEAADRNRQARVPVCVDLELMRLLYAIKMTNKNSFGEQWAFTKNESFLGWCICRCGNVGSRRIAVALYRARQVESSRLVSVPVSICLSMATRWPRLLASNRRR